MTEFFLTNSIEPQSINSTKHTFVLMAFTVSVNRISVISQHFLGKLITLSHMQTFQCSNYLIIFNNYMYHILKQYIFKVTCLPFATYRCFPTPLQQTTFLPQCFQLFSIIKVLFIEVYQLF